MLESWHEGIVVLGKPPFQNISYTAEKSKDFLLERGIVLV